MRYNNLKLAPLAATLLLSGFIIFFPFFNSKAQKAKKENFRSDSTKNKSVKINTADLDKALEDLDKVDFDAISKNVEQAMASVNFNEISKSIELAMQAVNADSIRLQVEAALKTVDAQKIQAEVDKAMAELKKSDWQKEMQKGLEEAQKSLKEVEKIDKKAIQEEMKKAQKEMAAAQVNMKSEMEKAKVDIAKAKTELTQLKTLMDEMKKDGLIKDNENAELEWKNDRLYINGKEQSEVVSEKYKALKSMHIITNKDDSNSEEL